MEARLSKWPAPRPSLAASIPSAVARARLRPDERDDVEILEAFWPPSPIQTWEQHSPPLVHPLLIYADLIATGDDRNISIAEQIYDDHLAKLHA